MTLMIHNVPKIVISGTLVRDKYVKNSKSRSEYSHN
jgi:hypothetical protein